VRALRLKARPALACTLAPRAGTPWADAPPRPPAPPPPPQPPARALKQIITPTPFRPFTGPTYTTVRPTPLSEWPRARGRGAGAGRGGGARWRPATAQSARAPPRGGVIASRRAPAARLRWPWADGRGSEAAARMRPPRPAPLPRQARPPPPASAARPAPLPHPDPTRLPPADPFVGPVVTSTNVRATPLNHFVGPVLTTRRTVLPGR
jgi:hypothetical protein